MAPWIFKPYMKSSPKILHLKVRYGITDLYVVKMLILYVSCFIKLVVAF